MVYFKFPRGSKVEMADCSSTVILEGESFLRMLYQYTEYFERPQIPRFHWLICRNTPQSQIAICTKYLREHLNSSEERFKECAPEIATTLVISILHMADT